MSNEPLVTAASITAGVTALIGAFVAFGGQLTGDQEKALLGIAAFVAPLIVAAIARRKVTPVDAEGRILGKA